MTAIGEGGGMKGVVTPSHPKKNLLCRKFPNMPMTDCYMGEGVEGKGIFLPQPPPPKKNHFDSAPEPYKLKTL